MPVEDAIMPNGGDDLSDVHRYTLQLLAQNLELIGRKHLELSPACIARNIGYADNDYVGEACRTLADLDMVERADDGPYYSITQRGLDYLSGDLDG